MRKVRVELGKRSYDITIKRGALSELGELTAALGFAGGVAVVTNPTVAGLYAEKVLWSLEGAGFRPAVITIRDGEEYKTLEEAATIYDALIGRRMERKSPVIALGGGVVGDVAGFVAATYLRGVPYIQVPTTLLSQVDSSVGGKTGVNHPLGKNLIGAFYQPRAVLIDPGTLTTLDDREFAAGMAEVIKYGAIWDASFFSFLEKNAAAIIKDVGHELEEAIERSCRIKADVVAADETEEGVRAILNFGHTFGHAIEALSGYGAYRHGEAVAIGMCMAADFSVSLGLCQADAARRLRSLVAAAGLPTRPPDIRPEAFIDAMRLDKKVESGRMRFVLLNDIGRVTVREAPEEGLKAFLAGQR